MPGQTVRKDVTLYTNVGFYGYVKDEANQAISGVKVSLIYAGYTRDIDYTDGNGRYDVFFVNPISSPTSVTLKFEKSYYHTITKAATGQLNQMVQKDATLTESILALIVAGETDNRFTHDAYNMYNTLIDHYSFTDNGIFLLTPHATDPISQKAQPK